MVPHHMRKSFEIKKVHFYTWFPHGTQKWIFARNDDSDALSIFGAQRSHSDLSNGVSDVVHLEQILFKFEILRFANFVRMWRAPKFGRARSFSNRARSALSNLETRWKFWARALRARARSTNEWSTKITKLYKNFVYANLDYFFALYRVKSYNKKEFWDG